MLLDLLAMLGFAFGLGVLVGIPIGIAAQRSAQQ